jgi:hypothetical protein
MTVDSLPSGILIPIRMVSTGYANGIVILCSLLLAFSYLAVALRFWTRATIIRSVGVDDYTVLLALVYFDLPNLIHSEADSLD